jgi:hypothetical protein
MPNANMGAVAGLTVLVNPQGVYTPTPTANADGSQDVAGANGTSVATPANPFPTTTNGVNGTGIASAANPFPVSDKGSAALATSQVTVGTGATQIVPARSGRRAVTIQNNGTGAFYVGVTGLTVANGYLVPGVVGASVTIPTQAAVFGIAAVAQAVSVLETF